MRENIFIIIEGPDRVGKSTLIQNLKNEFNDFAMHEMHYSNVKQSSADAVVAYSKRLYSEMFGFIHYKKEFPKSGLLIDRSHLGEMVYGPIYRGYSGEYVIDIERNWIDKTIEDDLFLITLVDDPSNLIDRDDGLSFSTNFLKKENEISNFKKAHNKSTIKNKILVNVGDNTPEETLQIVKDFIGGIE